MSQRALGCLERRDRRSVLLSLMNLKESVHIGNFDAYHDLKHARALTGMFNEVFHEYERLLEEDNEIDETYESLLLCVLIEEERFESLNKRKERDGDDGNAEENDPQYELFLKHLKEHDKSFVLEYDKDGLPVVIKYEGGIVSDKECDPETQRKFSRTMKQKTGLSSQTPGVGNQLKKDQLSNSVKKTKRWTWRKLANETGKVEKVKDLPGDTIPDPEFLSLHQNVKHKDEKYVYMHKNNTAVNEKIYGVNDYQKEKGRISSTAMKQEIDFPNQMPGVKNQHEHNLHQTSVKKTNDLNPRKSMNKPSHAMSVPEYSHLHQNVKLDNDCSVYMHNIHTAVSKKIYGVNKKIEKRRKLSRSMKQKSEVSGQMHGADNKRKHDLQSASVKKIKKTRNEADVVSNVKGLPTNVVLQPEYPYFHQKVKPEDEYSIHVPKGHTIVNEKILGQNAQRKQIGEKLSRTWKQKVGFSNEIPGADNQNKQNLQPASVKNSKSLTVQKSRNEAEKSEIVKCSSSEFRNIETDKCFMACKNIRENNLEKEGKDETISDVKILDDTAYLKDGIVSPFVPSKKFHEDDNDIQQYHGSRARDEYRKQILDVLRKPYDKEEYVRHRKAVKAGCYLVYHPDLGRKLKRYRYKRGKLLTVLRGFFFWLQNLTREGVFKPWEDRECLAVEPGSL